MGTGELVKVIRKILKEDRKPQAIDTEAEVKRVEDGIAWVHIPGGVDETPVKLTIDAKTGDTVQVRVAKGRAWLVGNATRPPTDDTEAERAQWAAAGAGRIAQQAGETASGAAKAATTAQQAAQAAQGSAIIANEAANGALCGLATVEDVIGVLERIQQHGTMTLTTDTAINPDHVYFAVDPNGEYVVQNVHYSVVAEPKTSELSTYYELTIDESLNNYVMTHVAVTSEGLWILPDVSGGHKILIATGAGSTYTSPGTYLINASGGVIAKFGTGAMIGEKANGKTRIEFSTVGMDIIQRVSGSDVQIAHLGYDNGKAKDGSTAKAPYFTFGQRHSGTVGNYSVAEGDDTLASGYASHSEGVNTEATGLASHSEGWFTKSSGRESHSEGDNTEASGDYSHAAGHYTKATRKAQTVTGEWNVPDTDGADGTERGKYAHIIGNGESGTTSNAYAVTWDGEVELYLKDAISTDPDYALSAAIIRRGWLSDVIPDGVLELKSLLTKLMAPQEETISPSDITLTKGTLSSATAIVTGSVCNLSIGFKNTSSIAAGQNVLEGVLPLKYWPKNYASLVGYWGKSTLACSINQYGVITIRNAGPDAITISDVAGVRGTYIVR